MLEEPPKKVEQKNSEVQGRLESKEEEKEDYRIYFPTVEEASSPSMAKSLIGWAKGANERLDKETASVEKKFKVLDQLVNYWKTEKEEPQGENDDLKEIKRLFDQINFFLELYQSKNAFIDASKAFNNFKDKKITLSYSDEQFFFKPENKIAFSWTNKARNIFSKKAKFERESLSSHAKTRIEGLILKNFEEMKSIIEKEEKQATGQDYKLQENISKIIKENYSDSREENFSVIAEKLKEIKSQFGNFRKFFEDLQKELLERKLAENIEFNEFSSINEKIKNLESPLPSYRINEKLNHKSEVVEEALGREMRNTRDHLNNFINNLANPYLEDKYYKEKRGYGDSREVADTSITYEYIVEIKKLQKKVDNLGRSNQYKKQKFFCTDPLIEGMIKEARDISSGRLLTHSGPTSVMYEVLRTGYLGSIDFLRKKIGKNIPAENRTHAMRITNKPGKEEETHDITFGVDEIYKNFTSFDDKLRLPGASIVETAHIAIIFSENHLLSQGNPYFIMDGIHVLDKNFKNEDVSKGIGINLREEPSMMVVVTEKEKERFLNFLKTDSFLKEDFSKMSGEEFDSWIDNNVIFVNSLDVLKDRERQEIKEVKENFLRKKGIKPKRGFVRVKEYAKAKSKTGERSVRQFVPRD